MKKSELKEELKIKTAEADYLRQILKFKEDRLVSALLEVARLKTLQVASDIIDREEEEDTRRFGPKYTPSPIDLNKVEKSL